MNAEEEDVDGRACCYRGVLISRGWAGNQDDHFPIPKRSGGKETVSVCRGCQDMKDRYRLGQWPVEWIGPVFRDFLRLSKSTRLLLLRFSSEIETRGVR